MKFRDGDELLAMGCGLGRHDKDLLVVTDEGFASAPRSANTVCRAVMASASRPVQLTDDVDPWSARAVVDEVDQVMAIMRSGKVIRSDVSEVKRTGRTTQGVTLAKPDKGDVIISIAPQCRAGRRRRPTKRRNSPKRGQSQPVEIVQTGSDGE